MKDKHSYIILFILLGSFILGLILGYSVFMVPLGKPVIYVYNSSGDSLDVNVAIDKEKLTFEYPYRTNGWWYVKTNDHNIIVYPSKKDRHNNINGKEYNYLFWEDYSNTFPYSFDTGFCIRGKDTREFLETTLNELGMNQQEINEFIVYWLPKMENNKYNVISFQTDNYNKYYSLKVEPKPDNILRVFMAYYSNNTPIDIEPQDLNLVKNNFKRKGLYIVEWGGSEL